MSTPSDTVEKEFELLRNHIQACPELPRESRAIQAALQGLDAELKRIERDAKLKRKFTSEAGVSSDSMQTSTDNTAAVVVTMPHKTAPERAAPRNALNQNDDDDEFMEWQDVGAEPGSLLGSRLAQKAVASMAQHGTTAKTPLAALALALHAATVSDILGFACTGIPETSKSSKGFAPPIRELQKGQFVPANWDESDSEICLRYRKPAVGSVILRLSLNGSLVQASLRPTNTTEPPTQMLEFGIEDHVNVESFQKALAKEGRVLPALHYKALPMMLTNYCNAFDLGSIHEEESTKTAPERLPYWDGTAVPPAVSDPLLIPMTRPLPTGLPPTYDQHERPNIQIFDPHRPNHGDFAGDLRPPGIGDMGDNSGMLLGPNHPMFGGVGGDSGFGMRPRFDPYGPPGGPQDPRDPNNQPPRRRPPPGGTGEPNPDHQRVPNNLSNNMFL
jgi:hypothetical protein